LVAYGSACTPRCLVSFGWWPHRQSLRSKHAEGGRGLLRTTGPWSEPATRRAQRRRSRSGAHPLHDRMIEQLVGLRVAVEDTPFACAHRRAPGRRSLFGAAPELASGDHLGDPQPVPLRLIIVQSLIRRLELAVLGIEAPNRLERLRLRHATLRARSCVSGVEVIVVIRLTR
jgi:hypothetical protein